MRGRREGPTVSRRIRLPRSGDNRLLTLGDNNLHRSGDIKHDKLGNIHMVGKGGYNPGTRALVPEREREGRMGGAQARVWAVLWAGN